MSTDNGTIPFEKLNYSSNNFFEWYENFLGYVTRGKQFVTAGTALKEGKHRVFRIPADKTDPLHKELTVDKYNYHYKEKVALFNLMIESLSSESKNMVLQDPDFDDALNLAEEENYELKYDTIALSKILVKTHVTEPGNKDAQITTEEEKLNLMRQADGQTITAYNEQYSKQIIVLKALEAPVLTDKKALARKYIYSLNANNFLTMVKDMSQRRNNLTMPETLETAMAKAIEWYNTESGAEKLMNRQVTPANVTRQPQVAAAGVAPNNNANPQNNKKKDKKGKNKGKNKDKSNNDNNNDGNNQNNNKGNKEKKKKNDKDNKGKGAKHCSYCESKGFTCDNHTLEQCGHIKRLCRNNGQQAQKGNAAIASSLSTPTAAAVEDEDNAAADGTKLYFMARTTVTTSTICPLFDIDQALALDTGCTQHLIRNKNLLTNIRKLKKPISVTGVCGTTTAEYEGEYKEFGTALYVPDSPLNLLSLQATAKYCDRKYNSDKDLFALSPYKTKTIYHFTLDPSIRLYVCRMIDSRTNIVAAPGMITVGSHQFTPEQVRRAKEAHEIHVMSDHMHYDKLGVLMDNGGILNCPYTSKDLRNAKIIFGPCPGCMQGKMTEEAAPTTQEEPLARGVKLHLDIMYMHDGVSSKKAPFLVGVEDHDNYLIVEKLPTRNMKMY